MLAKVLKGIITSSPLSTDGGRCQLMDPQPETSEDGRMGNGLAVQQQTYSTAVTLITDIIQIMT